MKIKRQVVAHLELNFNQDEVAYLNKILILFEGSREALCSRLERSELEFFGELSKIVSEFNA